MLGRITGRLGGVAGSRRRRRIPSGLTPGERDLISRIHSRRLTYLSETKLASLASTCRSIEDASLPGVFLEAGCALGGSAILIASLKTPQRPLLIYDVFDMIPPPTKEDSRDVHDRYRTIVEGSQKGSAATSITATLKPV